MKCNCVFGLVMILSLFGINLFAQGDNLNFIPSTHLAITFNKTTNLIFPYSVQSIDRGSKDILVQQPKGTENIVQLKANRPNFLQTNLSVITVDGKLYSFTVDYAAEPKQLNVVVRKEPPGLHDSLLSIAVKLTSAKNEFLYKVVAEKIEAKKMRHGRKDIKGRMYLQLGGVYINNDILYFRLLLSNRSNISYDVDNIRFSINDNQRAKRTATQELELTSLYTYKRFVNVPGDSSAWCIIATPKFTLPASKYLSIQVKEKNGVRNFNLDLKNRHIMNAVLIPE